jgi:hypothetical protein
VFWFKSFQFKSFHHQHLFSSLLQSVHTTLFNLARERCLWSLNSARAPRCVCARAVMQNNVGGANAAEIDGLPQEQAAVVAAPAEQGAGVAVQGGGGVNVAEVATLLGRHATFGCLSQTGNAGSAYFVAQPAALAAAMAEAQEP